MTLGDLNKGNGPKFDPEKIEAEVQDKVNKAAADKTSTAGSWFPPIFAMILPQLVDPADFIGMAFDNYAIGQLVSVGKNGFPIGLECENQKDYKGKYILTGHIRWK